MEQQTENITLTTESAYNLLDRLIRQEWPVDLKIGFSTGTNVPKLTINIDGNPSPHSIVILSNGMWRFNTSLPI